MSSSDDELLQSATHGFDSLFSNDIADAKAHFAGKDDPFHLLGAGVVAFMEAALGMEVRWSRFNHADTDHLIRPDWLLKPQRCSLSPRLAPANNSDLQKLNPIPIDFPQDSSLRS